MKNSKTPKRIPVGRLLLFSSLLLVCSVILGVGYLFFPQRQWTERVQIPDYRGQAYEALSFPSWMQVRVEYRHDAEAPGGRVISQAPAAHSFRKLGQQNPTCDVTLVVSLGEEQVILPNVVGMEHRLAEQELKKLGFSVKRVHEYGAYEAGRVWQIAPHPGALLPPGARVTLYVSEGLPEKSLPVPDLIGLSREDALVTLWLSGFSAADIYEEPAEADQAGRVIRQSHQPGTLLPAGTGICLWIGSEESM